MSFSRLKISDSLCLIKAHASQHAFWTLSNLFLYAISHYVQYLSPCSVIHPDPEQAIPLPLPRYLLIPFPLLLIIFTEEGGSFFKNCYLLNFQILFSLLKQTWSGIFILLLSSFYSNSQYDNKIRKHSLSVQYVPVITVSITISLQ